ncbi:deoxyribose-phosphate aldolase [Acidaminobacter hydrogenoformans]|uniref:Deoxyribose-phosphate aldolase n=1 Tax=Acidaminobacter hydrogenoformans DSM 2784 TaxID=1120920 RepID=A0A1G5RSK2_9FIRM|nr:deoxyribose-phosphate aldolase [Acidaminobacter hydrogenoformans]SCZ77074.1 deoxyribose-phosphate aldolase [Acidaminobacter hydrogenoformans DSM 2784]
MNLAGYIDHTILKADATREQVIQVCEEAKTHGFWSVCVNPYYVSLVAEALKGSSVRVCSVIGFPLGASVTSVKAAETRQAIEDGAGEIDMVINVAALKNGDDQVVLQDIEGVVAALQGKAILKVILETCLLTDAEKIKACKLSKAAGAHFVKTSTGFSTGGATAEDIALMRREVGSDMGVKASGGIRSREIALQMIEAGASRIGASASVAIVLGEESQSTY